PGAAPRGRAGRLHTQLVAAFGLVILVTLLSAGTAAVWLIQEYQTRLAVDRLSELAIAASLIGRQLELRDATPAEIGDSLAGQIGPPHAKEVRILILDAQDRVIAVRPSATDEVAGELMGRRLDIPPPSERRSSPGRSLLFKGQATVWTPLPGAMARPYTFITAPLIPAPPILRSGEGGADGGSQPGERTALRRAPTLRVVLAVPPGRLTEAWLELAPGLGLAALVALPVSVAVALWLSRSITRPLSQITYAAEDIARGNLRQEIPVQGSDEVAKLAQAFNVMSQEVARSHRALRDFLANASHELRTPLTSIQGFSQALTDGTLRGEEGAVQAGTIINEEALRMRRLVEDLLYLSRVEAHEPTAACGRLDLAGLLREAARRLQLLVERRGLRLQVDVPDLPPMEGDADELDHLFGNLLDNAGKYTPPGGTITLSAWEAEASLCVRVHNTGSVIPAQDLPHVFERFYRVDKSRARDVEGSGLGLAIAQEVAQRHQGRIEVHSTPEDGTTFLVSLPQRAGEARRRSAEPQPVTTPATDSAPDARGQPARPARA
ncbi:MAG TPA: ATP-binding protein, partial [Chloroflexota bacterium]|nr:ATP-binding protein [Chloroflexota bacterium]